MKGSIGNERHGAPARGRLVFALLFAAVLLLASFFRAADETREAVFRVDANSAGAAELTLLPGIGPNLAEKIVDCREAHGPFRAPDDLERVKGIGPKTSAGLAEWVRFD